MSHAPPTFWRSPRLNPNPPQREVEIKAPPSAPGGQGSLLTIIVPSLVMMVAMGAMAYFMSRQGGGTTMYLMMFMMVASPIGGISVYMLQKRRDKQKEERRRYEYRQMLRQQGTEIQSLIEEQLRIAHENDPDPQECLDRVLHLDRKLWTRSPSDNDFLALRVGEGRQRSTVSIKSPESHNPLDIDPLIADAQKVAQHYEYVSRMPIRLELARFGIAGLAGECTQVLSTAREMVVQLATHHAPTEVKLAIIYSQRTDWDWARWLPHVWGEDRQQRFLAANSLDAHRLLAGIEEVLDHRRRLLGESDDKNKANFIPRFVILVADPDLVENEPAIHRLLSEGPMLGAYAIFIREQSRYLPQNCRAIVRLNSGKSHINLVEEKYSRSFAPDPTPLELAERFARSMAPIRLNEAAGKEIPNSVSLLSIYGVDSVEQLQVLERWKKSETYGKILAVPMGLQMGSELRMLDLHERADGPNGLVAGMVGAGKSELLQTLVAALAIDFHPHRMAFVLVDFKGGGMADPFETLPHTLGIITNLQKGNLAVRALESFRVEANRRQMMFKSASEATGIDINHIDAYQRLYYQGRVEEPMPYLVIIVDEFAEMKTEEPEVAKDFIKIARLGRALGFRLILAMQKPAGIVDGQIEANTRFRLCLRVAQTEDSQAMLKRPEAAFLTGIGRAYLQVGANEVFELFQVAYSGAPYDPEGISAGDPREIKSVALNGHRELLYRPSEQQALPEVTQLQAVTDHLETMAREMDVKKLPGLWLPPLPEQIAYDKVRPNVGWNGETWTPNPQWLAPVIGLVDKPSIQEQSPFSIEFGEGGHLAVYGAPGFGKTTFLQTLITSLALSYSPEDINIYILDFGGRLLRMFEPLPHIGGVVTADEDERLHRLLDYLLREMERRRVLFGEARTPTLSSYRATTGKPLPAIMLLIDNYANFYGAYEDDEETIIKIARDGGNLGIHLVLTATGAGSVRFRVTSNMTMAVALNLVEKGDFGAILGKTDGLLPEPVPGRGLVRQDKAPLEFQTALPGVGQTDFERNIALRELMDEMSRCWQGARAKPIPTLPNLVSLPELLANSDLSQDVPHDSLHEIAVPLGIHVNDLTPFTLALSSGPNFLITGPVQSGKTSLLLSWIQALVSVYPDDAIAIHVLDSRRGGLSEVRSRPHVVSYSDNPATTIQILTDLEQGFRLREQKLLSRRNGGSELTPNEKLSLTSPIILVVDDLFDPFSDTTDDTGKDVISTLLRKGRGLGFHAIVAGGLGDIASKSWSEPIKPLKDAQVGFMMGRSSDDLFSLRLPYAERDQMLPIGEGYWTQRGISRRIKVAFPMKNQAPTDEKPAASSLSQSEL